MQKFYRTKYNYPDLVKSSTLKCSSIKVQNKSSKLVKYNGVEHSSKTLKASIIAVGDEAKQLGTILYLLEHHLPTGTYHWAVVELFKNCKCINGRWLAETVVDGKMLFPVSSLSDPLVTGCKK